MVPPPLCIRPMIESHLDLDEAVPAFLTLAGMPLTYSIANGISLGIVSWVAIKLLAGRWREVHQVLGGLAVVLAAFYGWR